MRVVWLLIVETRPRPEDTAPGGMGNRVLRWAIVGLAVIGVAALILWRLTTR